METERQAVKRIKVLGMPVDAADPEVAARALAEMLDNGQNNQVVFLSTRGLLRARRDPELARCLREAALVLPVSRALVRGARFLGAGALSLYNEFESVIRILTVVEKAQGAVYLLGARKGTLEAAEDNLRGSFHGIRVVGRYFGFYQKGIEASIVTAIKKSAPHLLLVGSGVAGTGEVDPAPQEGAESRHLAVRGQLLRGLRRRGEAGVEETARGRPRGAVGVLAPSLEGRGGVPLPVVPGSPADLQGLPAVAPSRPEPATGRTASGTRRLP